MYLLETYPTSGRTTDYNGIPPPFRQDNNWLRYVICRRTAVTSPMPLTFAEKTVCCLSIKLSANRARSPRKRSPTTWRDKRYLTLPLLFEDSLIVRRAPLRRAAPTAQWLPAGVNMGGTGRQPVCRIALPRPNGYLITVGEDREVTSNLFPCSLTCLPCCW